MLNRRALVWHFILHNVNVPRLGQGYVNFLSERLWKQRVDVHSSPNITFRDHSCSTYGNFSQKTNISYPLILTRTCVYQGVSNVGFSGNFARVLYEWSLIKTMQIIVLIDIRFRLWSSKTFVAPYRLVSTKGANTY